MLPCLLTQLSYLKITGFGHQMVEAVSIVVSTLVSHFFIYLSENEITIPADSLEIFTAQHVHFLLIALRLV
jgi:hypothetical protein